MDERLWDRVAAASGIVVVILLLVGTFVAGPPPEVNARLGAIHRYFVENRGALLSQGFLIGLAVVFGLLFLGSLRALLSRAEGDGGPLATVVFGAGLLVLGFAVIGVLFGVENAFRVAGGASRTSEGVSRVLFDLQSLTLAFLWFPVAALVGITSVLVIRTGVFPGWFGVAGAVAALLFLVAGIGIRIDSGALAPGGPFALATFFLLLAWIATASVFAVQRVGSTPRRRATTA